MPDIKGSTERVIEAPGYHVAPRYDLKGLRERVKGDGKKDTNVVLPLTSMIDMFSTLVIVLILNFSATGEVFFISKNMKLPETENGNPLKGLPLISITSDSVIFDAQKVGDNPLHIEESDKNLPQLRLALKKVKIFQETIKPGEDFKGAVNIQADEGLPIVYVKRVINTLVSEGWSEINFATTPLEE